jgi:hypothetical protein
MKSGVGGEQGRKLVFGVSESPWPPWLRIPQGVTAIFNFEGGKCSNVGLKQGLEESSWDNG